MHEQRDLLLQGALTAEANRDFPLAHQLYAQAASQNPNDPVVLNTWRQFLLRMVQLSQQMGVQPSPDQTPGSEGPDIVHPSFEFRHGLVLFGFNELIVKAEGDKIGSRKIRLVSSGGRTWLVEDERPTIKVGNREMILDLRYDFPVQLETQWSRDDLKAFLNTPFSVDGPAIYKALKDAVHRHIDLMDDGAEIILAVWPVLSFTFTAFPALPFILLLGPKSTGKTETLSVLEKLCRNGHRSKGTAASMGDLIQSRRATWLIDQANNLHPDMLQDLTDSYKPGKGRTVTNVDKRGEPHEFEIFGPKAFAAHKDFDEDLIDRCIQIEMAPAVRDTTPLLASDPRLDQIRWQLYRFTALNGPGLFQSGIFIQREEAGKALKLSDREWELWWPFEVLFEWLQVPLEDRQKARSFYRSSITSTKAELPEKDRAVLEALLQMNSDPNQPLVTTSDRLSFKSGSAGYIPPGELGKILKNHGLIEKKDRIKLDGKKLTQWVINRTKLQMISERWRIKNEED